MTQPWQAFRASQPPATVFDAVLLDLDGVLYVGSDQVPYAVHAVSDAHRAGLAVAYVTNNASRPPKVVAEHLSQFGLPVSAEDVVTSAQAGAHLMADLVPEGSIVLAVGGEGVAIALQERGLIAVRDHQPRIVGVMQGFGPQVAWSDLAAAAYTLAEGVPWVATNMDLTVPTPHGIAPGNGSFVRMLAGVVGRQPDAVAGKPESALVLESTERVGAVAPLMVGDRLDTDIEAGRRAGIPTLLVLTGVTDARVLLAAAPHERPDLLSIDLRGLHDEHPAVEWDARGAHCEGVWVSASRTGVQIEAPPLSSDPAARRREVEAVWRCCAVAVWDLLDDAGLAAMDPHAFAEVVDQLDALRRAVA